MKYIPQKNLFFVHIPKCGGISVRAALSQTTNSCFKSIATDLDLDEVTAEYLIEGGGGKLEHKEFGRFDPAHLPLTAMREMMPLTWNNLEKAKSFALTRAPRDRFISAVLQRLLEFKDFHALRAEDPIVKEESKRVCDWLDQQKTVFIDPEYIHFSRQMDYIGTPEGKVIDAIFPVGDIQKLKDWLETSCDVEVSVPHTHTRRQPKSWLKNVYPMVRIASRSLLPTKLKKTLYPMWVGSRFFDNSFDAYDQVFLGSDVEQFISSYYEADATLHNKSLQASEC